MSDQPKQSLIDDLEAIRHSLDKIADSKPVIPTLEEIVGHRPATPVNPENPFLSSTSLSELIRIRNEAEAKEAEELAAIEQVRPVNTILRPQQADDTAAIEADISPAEEVVTEPDPEQLVAKLEAAFDTWKEKAVKEYLLLFEQELNERLKQDFRELVRIWYREHNLPVPEAFMPASHDDSVD
jgi:hypothetical protein